LKRRYDLIPNLIETAKGYIKYERDTLQAVVEARNTAQGMLSKAAADPGNADAIKGLTGALSGSQGQSEYDAVKRRTRLHRE
jgi:LemA protein